MDKWITLGIGWVCLIYGMLTNSEHLGITAMVWFAASLVIRAMEQAMGEKK